MLQDTPDNEDLVLGPCNRDLSPRNSCSGPRNTNGGPPNTYGRPPLAASPLAISYISPCNCYFGPQNNYGGPCNTCGKPYHAHVGCSDPLWGEPRGPLRPAQLPADVLPHILEHIDCKQRLGECALVAPAWRTAAVAATEDIQLTLGNSTTVSASLVEWLRRSGSGIRSIDLEYRSNHSRYYDNGDDDINPNLPFQQLAGLRSLSLRGVDISELRDLWHLTSLVVGGESVDDQCAENLAQFSGLRALTVINPAKDKPDNREYDKDDDDDDDGDLNWLTSTVYCRGIYKRNHFTFRGLRSLMQLKGLQVFAISRDTCLFQGVGSGDEDEYNDITAFQGCDDEDLHRLLQRNSKWHAFNTKEHQEQLAGVQQQVATLEWELAAAATRRESLDYEMRSQQREIDQQRCEIDDKQHTIEEKEYEIGWQQHEIVELQRMIVYQQGEIIDQQREAGDLQGRIVDQQGEIVDQQREIHHQQREIAGLQHEVWRLRQQQRYRQREQWEQDQYEHRHSRRRQW
ncbi:hypothetical protein OEZ86_010872 [Tetradesmus obliquus]|nr:hypothetical protein OEZ86_010872 [Tetradesmus obliquus]